MKSRTSDLGRVEFSRVQRRGAISVDVFVDRAPVWFGEAPDDVRAHSLGNAAVRAVLDGLANGLTPMAAGQRVGPDGQIRASGQS